MLKIVLCCLISAIICFYLKNTNKDFFPLALVGSCVIILFQISEYLTQAIDLFQSIINVSNVDGEVLKIIFKITGIGIVIEFGSNIIYDLEMKSLGDKLVFLGKILIILSSIPIIYSLFEIIKNLLEI